MNIKAKTVLITGGASGIGLEAAKQFLSGGAKVIITGRNQAKLDEASKILPSITTIKGDVSSADDAVSLFKEVKRLGGIDILYNNAGVLNPSSNLGVANELHFEKASAEIQINYLGVIRLNNCFMDMLQSREESAIINTTSILSYMPSLIEATYSASKVALRFYTEALRKHLRIMNSHVKLFELLPPVVATEMTAARGGKKMSTEEVVEALITGLKKDQYTIRVGNTKALYILSRLFPKMAFGLVNPKKSYKTLQS
ncbi:MAG: SDR family NAD(P)-dependent oxidoreductase [Ferruginibacter sp.]